MSLEGRAVIITGATGGLGAGIVKAFVDARADVIGLVHSAPEDGLDGVRYETVDLTSDEAVAELFTTLPTPWAVVNTVGGYAPHRPMTELDPGELTTQFTLNLTTAAILTKHALRAMQETGEGRIIHTASRAATHTTGTGFAYSVTKAGVLHLVAMAAEEVAKTDIRINAVSPSIIDTPANRAAMPKANHDAWPTPERIARAYLFLASQNSELVNGATLPV